MQSQARTEIQPADSEAEASAHHDDALLWLSPSRARWAGPGRMPTLRQVELIEEYISSLPPLHWNRQTYSERPHESLQRDQTVELKPSKVISGLTAVYLKSTNMNKSEEAAAAAAGPMAASSSSSSDSNALLLDYPGWVMTAEEYENFGYAIHTAVSALDLEDPEEMHNYVILGQLTRHSGALVMRQKQRALTFEYLKYLISIVRQSVTGRSSSQLCLRNDIGAEREIVCELSHDSPRCYESS